MKLRRFLWFRSKKMDLGAEVEQEASEVGKGEFNAEEFFEKVWASVGARPTRVYADVLMRPEDPPLELYFIPETGEYSGNQEKAIKSLQEGNTLYHLIVRRVR